MKDKETPYVPIDCNFYDKLEEVATLKKVSSIRYIDSNGKEAQVAGKIVDLYAINSIEYLKLGSGLEIRLDQVMEVNGEILPGQC
ncbi:MAG: hypothetical protein AAF694_07170 [Bacteroidota bacterium]